ncbi:MAG: CsgG/HfaB family protein [Treponema sp.]|jgi:TolB-like protein|nr:CsgG/HfaB family protein [Treponema sp.]
MKGLLTGIVGLFFLGCVTTGNVVIYKALDLAINQACQNIQNDFDERANIAVLNIDSSSNQLSAYIIEETINNFINMHMYKVVERSKISAILSERDFQLSGEVSDDEIQSIGNMLGAQFVVSGSVDDVGDYYRLRLFVIAVESGERKSSTAVNIKKPNTQVDHLMRDARLVKGYSDIFSELDKILNSNNSPDIYIYSPDMSGEISSEETGVIFATREGLKGDALWMAENRSDEGYELRKISGEWELVNSLNYYDVYGVDRSKLYYYDDKTYKELIEDVIYGYSAIMIYVHSRTQGISVWK